MMLYGNYTKESVVDGERDIDEKRTVFQTKLTELLQNHDISDTLSPLFDDLVGQTDEFTTKGSGWALQNILYLEVHINKYSPLKGGTYIELPPSLKAKHACYNPKKYDNDCFKWVVRGYFRLQELNHEFPVTVRSDVRNIISDRICKMTNQVAERIDRQYGLNWQNMEFPVDFNGINDFVAQHDSISIKIYGVKPDDDKTIVGPLFDSGMYETDLLNIKY